MNRVILDTMKVSVNTDPVAIPHIATTLSLPQTTDHDNSSSTPPGDIREAQLADNIIGPILWAKESTPPQKPNNGTLHG